MAKDIAVGIDIGTYQVKVMVAERLSTAKNEPPRVIGTGFTESRGLRHGYIVNQDDVTKSVLAAISQAERASGIKIRRATIAIGGVGLGSIVVTGGTAISRADAEVSEHDIEAAIEQSKKEIPPALIINRTILHILPIQYRLDGKTITSNRPIGLKGSRLEVKTLFITSMEQHFNDLIAAVENAGVEVEDTVASPIAASEVTLTKAQKIAGVVLTNIGAETVTIVVFEEGIPISLEIFPLGSTDITNDIALGLKIPLEEAEDLKRGNISQTEYPKKKLDEIVAARVSDIFELIEAHLKKIGKNGLLPAGIVLTGGGSGITTIEDLAKASLNLPSRVANLGIRGSIKDAFWSVSYGLCSMTLSGNIIGQAMPHQTGLDRLFKSLKRVGRSILP